MEGFAFPRRFVKDGLAESLSKNMRALLAFLNERVVRYDAGGTNVTLPGNLTVDGDIDVTDLTVADVTLSGTISGGTFDGDITEESWTAPTLVNSWVDYGSGFQTTRYRKDSNGIVHIQGLVKDGTAATVFTLPSGYRPAAALVFTTWGGATPYRLNIASTGVVSFPSGYGATPYMSVSCSFAT